MVHIGNDEFLNHDSGEELERKEWTQEIFNRTEPNIQKLSSIVSLNRINYTGQSQGPGMIIKLKS